jgi:hypothetical protein
VDFHAGLANAILAQGDLYVLRSEGRVVWWQVLVRPGVDPARGAEAAQTAGAFLMDHVLLRRSSWIGVVLDVRQAPSVFGPITLGVCERLFRKAEEARKPLAVVLGNAPAQRAQFSELVREHAPDYAMVFDAIA